MKSPVFPPEKQLDLSSAVNSMSTSNNEQAQLLDHESSVQVTLPVETKGRGRTSVVVLGLALSMGTSSLLLPLQTKKALAFDVPAESKALEVATASPVSTPSPIASPVPSALELAISTATGVNAVPSPAGFTTVSPGSEGLVSLSQQSLATPTPIALPTPLATPTQDLQVAATVEPTVTPTVEELSQSSPIHETEAAQAPESQPSQAAIAPVQPALPAPVPSHAATPAPEPGTSGLTISNSLSLVSPTPETTPIVTETPQALATPTTEATPSVAAAPSALPSIEPAQPTVPVQSAAVSQTPALVESSKLVELSVHSVELLKGTTVAVLPPLKQLQSEDPSVPSTVTIPAASLSATPAPSLNSTLPQAPAEAAVPTLIAQVPSTPLTQAATPIESSSPALTALLDAQPASQPLSSGSSLVPEANTLPNGLSYRVNRGDTLNVIARRYGVSVAELVSANNLVNPNSIEVDQEIRIPSPQNLHINASLVRSTTESVSSLSPAAVPASLAAPEATDLNTATSTNYIQNLKAEIEALQRKYQPQAAMAMAAPGLASPQLVTTPVVAPTPTKTAEPVNPEYVSAQATVQANVQTTAIRPLPVPQMPSQLMASQVQRVTVSPALEPQQSLRVAAAPLAPTTYIPTMESTGGASVSPQLPPLAAAETYLPGDKTNFKGYIWPAKGVLTSGYGWRWGRMHRGVDVAGPTGTPILAAATGIVEYAQWNNGGYGYLVDIRHPDGSLTRYGHNSRILVREGQRVQQGQLISEMGSTGFSTGPHLHFEIHPANQGAVNPMAFLPRTSPG